MHTLKMMYQLLVCLDYNNAGYRSDLIILLMNYQLSLIGIWLEF